jgi:hypothetical protein
MKKRQNVHYNITLSSFLTASVLLCVPFSSVTPHCFPWCFQYLSTFSALHIGPNQYITAFVLGNVVIKNEHSNFSFC